MVKTNLSYNVSFYGLTDVGLVRKNNEDIWLAIPESNFYMLADGMGGHNAGEIAASKTAESLQQCILKIDKEAKTYELNVNIIAEKLKDCIKSTNSFVYKLSSSDEQLKGMGTTLCCIYAYQNQLLYTHVGDSRIYRYRDEDLEQLTQDHSLINELISLGQLNPQDAGDFPFKNVLTKSIGTCSQIDIAVTSSPIIPGDIYLLCSDGLTNFSQFDQIKEIFNMLASQNDLKQMCDKLIALAKEHGGGDNITVVIVKFEK